MARLIGTLQLDAGSVKNEHILSTERLDADIQQHLYRAWTNFDLAATATPVARVEVVYVAEVAGTIRQFAACCYDSGTAASVTFDLLKNGVSVLSSTINIVHGTGDRVVVDGTISSATVAVGDVFTMALAVSSSTGMQGPMCWATFEENGAP
jgi:hypothetical protein